MLFQEKYGFFVEIAECGSITKAANNLLISQSALSKYLHRLEAAVNAQLFDRRSLPLNLTRAGEIFLRYVVQGIDMEKQCMAQIESLKENLVETLRVGIGPWRGSCFFPLILPAFQEKYPFIKLEVLEDVSDALADAVLKGSVDLCIMGAPESYPALNNIPLCNERIFLVGNSSHPIVRRLLVEQLERPGFPHADLQLFRKERFILTSPKQGFARAVEHYFAQVNFSPTDCTRIESLHTGTYMVANSNCFTFLPEIATRSISLPENLAFLTFGQPEPLFPIAVTYSKSAPLSNAARLFIEVVLNYYSQNTAQWIPFLPGQPQPAAAP